MRRVLDQEDLHVAVEVNVEAFGMRPEIAERYLGPALIADPRTRLYVAFLDGEPVAAASTHVHARTVGVFGVGVLERARRRGIGTAITALAVDDVRGSVDLAWLHPTQMGRHMYEVMGFRPISDWAVYVRTDPCP